MNKITEAIKKAAIEHSEKQVSDFFGTIEVPENIKLVYKSMIARAFVDGVKFLINNDDVLKL